MLQVHPLEEETPSALRRGPTRWLGSWRAVTVPSAQCDCSYSSAGGGGTVWARLLDFGVWPDGPIAVGHVPRVQPKGTDLSPELGVQ